MQPFRRNSEPLLPRGLKLQRGVQSKILQIQRHGPHKCGVHGRRALPLLIEPGHCRNKGRTRTKTHPIGASID